MVVASYGLIFLIHGWFPIQFDDFKSLKLCNDTVTAVVAQYPAMQVDLQLCYPILGRSHHRRRHK